MTFIADLNQFSAKANRSVTPYLQSVQQDGASAHAFNILLDG